MKRPRSAKPAAAATPCMLPNEPPPLLAKAARSCSPVRVRVSTEAHTLKRSRRVGKCDAVYQGRVLRSSEYARARHEGQNDCSKLTCLARSDLGDQAWARAAPGRPEPFWPCKLFMSRPLVNTCARSHTRISLHGYDRKERSGLMSQVSIPKSSTRRGAPASAAAARQTAPVA